MDTFRRWWLPALIMAACLLATRLLALDAGDGVFLGWVGGIFAAWQHPDIGGHNARD